MQLSTCNQWQGTIVSEVTLEISPEISVTAIVSKSSVEKRGVAIFE